jgi:succinate dehydrogenase/fumarate reductase flavoprotein subunit
MLLAEQSDQVGGTGATSAGTLWIPGNTQSRAAGFNDSAEQAETYLHALIGPGANRELIRAYLQTGPEAIDYLEARSDMQFLPCGKHPDYRNNMPGAAVTGRAIVAKPFDGRLLGADFKRVRPPIREFMLLGGMMVGKEDIAPLIGRFRSLRNFMHAAKLFWRYLIDRLRYPRGTRITMGNALMARLYFSLRMRNVPILFDAPIVDVIGGRDGVTGARLRVNGSDVIVKTRKGVVLATGGYAHNKTFRERFMPQPAPAHSLSYAGNRGDGISIGERIGAAIAPERCTSGLWTPVSITPRADGSKGLYPHLSLDRAKPGLIAVNSAGRRFVNEGLSYHDFVLAMFESHKAVPSIPAYLICDATFIRKYGLGDIHPGTRNLKKFEASGYLVSGRTLDDLAAKIHVDAAGLRDSVARNNKYAASGVDVDFGKGELELNRFNGDPAHMPNPCLGPIATAPFYAVAVWPADIAVSTGLATDADARVLDTGGKPIPGLYACGNDMASVMGGSYPGPGTTLGPGIVFAYRAAMHARGPN